MVGVAILIVAVIAAVVFGVVGSARQGAAAGRQGRAFERVRAALQADGGPEAAERSVREVARSVGSLGAADAEALVVACRKAFSRQVVPILAAAAAHPAARVSDAAAQALTDIGAPGLRAVWQAVDGGSTAAGHRAFLTRHPDWLFERLMESYAAGDLETVRRHEALWREAGLVARLDLLEQHSDAINHLRAEGIGQVLSAGAGRGA